MKKYNLEISILLGDGYETVKDKKFDVILLNPPQHAGKDLCFRLIEQAKDHLTGKGSLQIVARHQKGGKPLKRKMGEVFGNVEVIGRGSGYQVYKAVNF